MMTVCKDCRERYPACHDYCEKYQEERRKHLEARRRERVEEMIDSTTSAHKAMLFERMRKSHRR